MDIATTIATRPGHTLSNHQLFDAFLEERILADGLSHRAEDWWESDASLDLPYRMVASNAQGAHRRSLALLTPDGCVIGVRTQRTRVTVSAHAQTAERACELLDELRALLPAADRRRDDEVAVHFWSLGGDGPTAIRRMIRVPAWGEIAPNYHASTREQLDALLVSRPDGAGGKLILWHGPPGTGKTWALRALVHEWSGWLTAHYVTDPEQFFGSSPTYLQHVVLDQSEDDDGSIGSDGGTPQWRLLIMEDTGELLARDAHERVGQALSRLLNVCDGLIGQGLRIMVLITTNEDLASMHPAVTRAGRCIANIRFDALDREEVAAWAERTGRPIPPHGAVLADLFSGGETQAEREPIGFRRVRSVEVPASP